MYSFNMLFESSWSHTALSAEATDVREVAEMQRFNVLLEFVRLAETPVTVLACEATSLMHLLDMTPDIAWSFELL